MPDIETIILSGDLDTLQLINPKTKVYSLRRGVKDIILYDQDLVKEKYGGLTPGRLLDFKALKGDPSDNIPGVTGIGEKTAIDLLLKFGSLENLYKELEELSDRAKTLKPKLRETLLKYKEQAFFSKSLAKIKKDVPIDFNLKKFQWGKYEQKKIIGILENYEFQTLIKRLPEIKRQESVKKNLKLW